MERHQAIDILGRTGEKIIANMLIELGLNVQESIDHFDREKDFLVDGKKVEVKTEQPYVLMNCFSFRENQLRKCRSVDVLYFVSIPLYTSGAKLMTVFLTGALFGLVAYATYDLTNQATVKNWPMIVTLVDLAWGSFLTGTTATCAVIALRTFL